MCDWTTDPSGRAAAGLDRRVRPSRVALPGGPGRLARFECRPGLALVALVLSLVLPPDAARAGQSREALQRAAVLVQEGRLEEADQQARLALADPETRPVAQSILGVIHLQQGRLEDAARSLEEAIRLEPRLVGAQLSLAQVYTRQGRGERALEIYRRVLEVDPSNAAARIALAGSEAAKGNYAGSLALARPALAVFEQSAEGLFVLATAYVKTGDRESAARMADHWRRLADVPPVASVRFAQLLAEGGVVAESVEVLEQARRADTSSYEAAFALGGAHLRNDDPPKALDAYDQALVLRPESVPALRQAAAVAEKQGELERALSYLLRARKVERDHPEILLSFGRVCLKMDLLDDAEAALTRAAALRPGEAPYQYALATAKVGKKQFEEAQALLEPLVEKRPEDAQLQYALGSVLYTRGYLQESAERLRESLRLSPEQLASRYYLALVARDQGRDAEAVEALEELLRRHPDHTPSCEALGSLLTGQQRYAEAETYLRKAIQLDPGSMKANYQLGLLLARTGRKEEADRQLALASTLREDEEAASRLQLRLLDPGL